MDKGRLIRGMMGQLESELTLGGKWLPIGKISLSQSSQVQGRRRMPKNNQDEGDRSSKVKRLAEVASEVAACKRCPLYETRHNPVPGEGDPGARLVFVGEAPGEMEDQQGRPFTRDGVANIDAVLGGAVADFAFHSTHSIVSG